MLILGIGAVLMFVGGTGLKWFVLAGAGGAAAIGAAIIIMPDLVPYAASRLSSWLDPFADPLGDGHQTIQSLYAIGSGGAAGLGLGSSRQKHLLVPEPQNDFIFSILCEELGFVGACAVILLFALLLWRGITLAAHAPDRFGALLVVGFVVQVALQAVLNMAVVTNTIPNTGISLPFFSSGGTSLMMLLGEMGIVLSVKLPDFLKDLPDGFSKSTITMKAEDDSITLSYNGKSLSFYNNVIYGLKSDSDSYRLCDTCFNWKFDSSDHFSYFTMNPDTNTLYLYVTDGAEDADEPKYVAGEVHINEKKHTITYHFDKDLSEESIGTDSNLYKIFEKMDKTKLSYTLKDKQLTLKLDKTTYKLTLDEY